MAAIRARVLLSLAAAVIVVVDVEVVLLIGQTTAQQLSATTRFSVFLHAVHHLSASDLAIVFGDAGT